jgi:hypothetical protein
MSGKLTVSLVETARQNLDALPPAPKESKEVGLGEVIRSLTPTIRKLLGKGYSRSKVIALLQEQGIPVTRWSFRDNFRQKVAVGGRASGAACSDDGAGEPGGAATSSGNTLSAARAPQAAAGVSDGDRPAARAAEAAPSARGTASVAVPPVVRPNGAAPPARVPAKAS